MPSIPRDPTPDASLAMLRDPYRFISARCRRFGADLFQTRLLLSQTICLTGPDAAALFYDPDRMQRAGAAPEPLLATLLGKRSVQTLDADAHRHRKRMFLDITAPDRVDRLRERVGAEWDARARGWRPADRVTLYDEARAVFTRAVCDWAGVPLPAADHARRTAQLTALFESPGSVGPKHLWGRVERKRLEAWAAGLIEQVRAGTLRPAEDAALAAVARHRDLSGELLPARVAAVELLNVLRPVVAVAVYAAFVGHALHTHPESRDRVRAGEPGYAERFVQEVRRFYPFFPAAVARTRRAFEWHGYPFPAGVRVMLDVYGTNHDPRVWGDPEAFRPDRFRDRTPGPFEFIPQGGGDAATGHRCPGEGIAVAVMMETAEFLTQRLTYIEPAQDWEIDMTRLPALPKGRVVLTDCRLTAAAVL